MATVDQSGKVKAVGAGYADITASYNGKTSKAITVKPTKIDTSITLALTKNPDQNNDVASVECTVSGLAADATGTVTFSVKGTSGSVNVSNGGATWTYADADNLIGNVEFTAAYSGDNKYNRSSSDPATLNDLNRTYDVAFTDGNSEGDRKLVTKDMSDSEEVSFSIPVDESALHGRTLSYTSSDETILKVDGSGNVTVVGNGSAYLSVKAAQEGYYL